MQFEGSISFHWLQFSFIHRILFDDTFGIKKFIKISTRKHIKQGVFSLLKKSVICIVYVWLDEIEFNVVMK